MLERCASERWQRMGETPSVMPPLDVVISGVRDRMHGEPSIISVSGDMPDDAFETSSRVAAPESAGAGGRGPARAWIRAAVTGDYVGSVSTMPPLTFVCRHEA